MRWDIFDRSHYDEYFSWYEDDELDRWLGPLDEEWLKAVLIEKDGVQYAIFNELEMVAVIGVKFGNQEHQETVITDIAIHPSLRHKGYGSQVLTQLYNKFQKVDLCDWAVYVDNQNIKALSFFKKHNWVEVMNHQEADGMLKLKPK